MILNKADTFDMSEILTKISEQDSLKERINMLKYFSCESVKNFLIYALGPNKFTEMMKDGPLVFTPSSMKSSTGIENHISVNIELLGLKDGSGKSVQSKRSVAIQILEGLPPEEAELYHSMFMGKFKWYRITKPLVNKAFGSNTVPFNQPS